MMPFTRPADADAQESKSGSLEAAPKTTARSSASVTGLPKCQQAGDKKKGVVTVATIGARPLRVRPDTEPQRVVQRVIAYWRDLFARVLPDRPDLIVVPEACDRPLGLSSEQLAAYYRVRKNQVQDFVAVHDFRSM